MRLQTDTAESSNSPEPEEDLTQPALQQAGTTTIRPENAYNAIRS